MEVADKIVGPLGLIEKVDVGSKGFSLGKYLRIRVNIDISKPLCRGRVVRMGATEKEWVDFRYERLPIFCYWCGKLDHDGRDCPLWLDSNESLELEERQYGPWLRAEMDRLQRPQVAEALSRKNERDGIKSGNQKQSKNQAMNSRWRSSEKARQGEVGEIPTTLVMSNPMPEAVMMDVTFQKKKEDDFETQLREINCAIHAVDTVKERMGNREAKEESRVATDFSNSAQSEALSVGGKVDKPLMSQRPYLGPLTDPAGPARLGRNQVEAQRNQSHMAQAITEGGRVLRSKVIDICLKD